MNNPLHFELGKATYLFAGVDELEEFVLTHAHLVNQLGDALDVEINAQKRQTLIEYLAETVHLLHRSRDWLSNFEKRMEADDE